MLNNTDISVVQGNYTSYIKISLFVVYDFRWDIVASLDDIDGIDDHHYLNILFIIEIYFMSARQVWVSTIAKQGMDKYRKKKKKKIF